jgi:outer membrane protein assembly factor BamB
MNSAVARGARRAAVLVALALVTTLTCGYGLAGAAARPVDAVGWPAYLNGPLHSSFSPAQTAITPANAAKLYPKWHDFAGVDFLGSPIVADDAIFIGSTTGWFYKINPLTGAVERKVPLGNEPQNVPCAFTGTEDTATVATDPRDDQLTVYIGSANGYLYALNAANLAVRWRAAMFTPSPTEAAYYDWSSPTVADGKVYIGLASGCDDPMIRGGLLSFDEASGKRLAAYYTMPPGQVGGSIWSSAAVAPDGDVYATTGNGPGPERDELIGKAESILKLSPGLKLLGWFQLPARQNMPDSDFGASPVLYGSYVGACNKNGIFYSLRQSTMKLAWEARIGARSVGSIAAECSAAPVFNGKDLFFGGPGVMLDHTAYRGSIQERVPATGKLVWETGLPSGIIGSPTMDGAGVLAFGTFDNSGVPNATYLANAANGKVLHTLLQGWDFAQSVFADGLLFTANSDGVYAWSPPR